MTRAGQSQGLTLVEVVVASLLLALIAGGTMLAIAASVKHGRSSLDVVDAIELAQQTAERLRNHVACDDAWFNPSCTAVNVSQTDDPISPDHPIKKIDPGAHRFYTEVPWDCVANLSVPPGTYNCSKLEVTVTHTPLQ